MILTGKTKEDFILWLNNQPVAPYEVMLDDIPKCYLNALIIEWFDSVGIYIEISFYDDCYWTYNIYSNKPVLEKETANICNNRQEATEEAIKKANEIYNSTL